MGLLDKLWDDTLAGPRPESGLGRLRKYSSFAFRPASSSPVTAAAAAKDEAATGGSGRPYGEGSAEEEAAAPRVTRSIMIKRPAGWASPGGGTPPPSPGGSTPPVSPFSGAKLFRRKSMSDAQGWKAEAVGVEATTSSCPPFEL